LIFFLVSVGLCAMVEIVVVHQSSGATSAETLLQTVARIHRNGGRLMMLDDAEVLRRSTALSLAGVCRQRRLIVRGKGGGAGVSAGHRDLRCFDAEEEPVHH
jgi:hypothetical protein